MAKSNQTQSRANNSAGRRTPLLVGRSHPIADVRGIQVTFNLIRLNLCLMVSPVGRIQSHARQPGRVLARYRIAAEADGFAQPPPPAQGRQCRPLSTASLPRARATLPAPCLRSAVRSSPSSCADARPRHPKDMGLERRMRKPRYSSSIPFYIERLPTYN
jgi:hypothetical protein